MLYLLLWVCSHRCFVVVVVVVSGAAVAADHGYGVFLVGIIARAPYCNERQPLVDHVIIWPPIGGQ